MQYRFAFHEAVCIGCGACAVACMDQNDRDPLAGIPAYRRIEKTERLVDGVPRVTYSTTACLHCDPAPCAQSCPMECFLKEDGLTVYDNAACIGCRMCYHVCPVQAPVFDLDGRMNKCDGCIGRLQAGLEPACVRGCPYGAIRVEVVE